MFSPALDLTYVSWKAEHVDGVTINKGQQTYPLIRRDKLEAFSLILHNKVLFTVRPTQRTLVARIKTWNQALISTGEIKNSIRFWIVALLAKPQSEGTTQHVICDFDPKWEHQHYDIDTEESSIHYLFENGKLEVRTRFGNLSPFTPLHLRAEEFKHLMGIEDPTKKKNATLQS